MSDKSKSFKPLFREKLYDSTVVPENIGKKTFTEATFTSVTKRIEELKKRFSGDSVEIEKQLKFLQSNLIDIDETSRAKLSSITREIGNTVLNFYEEKSQQINDQRSENLKLQLELANLLKEKNSIEHQVKNLHSSIKKLEEFLGIDPNPEFDSNFHTTNLDK